VLAAEDEETDRFILKRAFQKAGIHHSLLFVCDGEEAIDYLNGTEPYHDRARYPLPSLLLLDLKMPRRTGFEVLAWLAAAPEFKSLPVVVLSSSSHESDTQKARQLGAREYIVKPHDLSQFVEMVRDLCGRWLGISHDSPEPPTGSAPPPA
jgi:CheY-like chemotaxis protein